MTLVTGIIQKNTATGDVRATFGSNGIVDIAEASGFANVALSNLSGVAINTALLLGTSDGAALGSSSKMWSDLFLASGGVINWNAGNVTLTHSAGALTLNGTLTATTFIGALTGNASSASLVNTTNDATTATSVYPTWVSANTGNNGINTTSTKLSFVPSTGVLTSTSFTGAGTGLTGTASSLSIGGSAPAGSLTGTTLASNVVTSSLTSVGTITSGVWAGTTIAVANGGTGLTSLTANRIPYGNGTSAYQSTSALTYDGTYLNVGANTGSNGLNVNGANPLIQWQQAGVAKAYAQWIAASSYLNWDAAKMYFTGGNVSFQQKVGIGVGASDVPLSTLCIDGGLHVGGLSDAGDNNLLVDGTTKVTGTVTIGTVTNAANLHAITNSGTSYIFETQAALVPTYVYRRSGAATANLSNGDAIASINFDARANSSWLNVASIYAEYSGNGTTQSGNLQFYTANSGSAALALQLNADKSAVFQSSVAIGGGLKLPYTAKTTTYTITRSDYYINCTSGTFTVTLPTAVGIAGQTFVVKNSGAGTITIATTSSQTIDGSASVSLNITNMVRGITSDGANWILTEVPL